MAIPKLTEPLISLIIIAYNCEDFIGDCLDSAVSQKLESLEIITVNDGSTDATLDIIQAYASRDERIRVINQENSGSPAAARNRGLKEARGKYVAFLDGDDLIHHGRLKSQLSVFKSHPDVSIVFCDIVQFKETPQSSSNFRYLRDSDFLNRARNYLSKPIRDGYLCADNFYNFMSTQITTLSTLNIIVDRLFLLEEDVRFPEDMLIGEDIDLWFRLAKRGKLAFVDLPLSYYRLRDDSVSHQSEIRFLKGSLTAHGANYERGKSVFTKSERTMLENRLASQYFSLGYLYSKAHAPKTARKAILTALRFQIRLSFITAYIKTYFLRHLYKPS